ncbi:TPA: hypothetical protein ACNIM8_001606 [Pseudomonas aeruginosa]
MRRFPAVFLSIVGCAFFSHGAVSAPSATAKKAVSDIVERSGQNLGGLIECDRQDLRAEYLTSLRDALSVYPGVDQTKARALIRQIERQGEVIGRLGIKSIPFPTEEDLERQRRVCEWQVGDAKRDIRALDDFILQ